MFQGIFHSTIAAGGRRPFQAAMLRTPEDYIEDCPACKKLKQCVWQKHMPDLLKKVLLTNFKAVVDEKTSLDAKRKRNAAYRYINGVIDGPSTGKRRGLPNCVVAGIRGFMYGDGSRSGYQSNPNEDNAVYSALEQEGVTDIAVSYSDE